MHWAVRFFVARLGLCIALPTIIAAPIVMDAVGASIDSPKEFFFAYVPMVIAIKNAYRGGVSRVSLMPLA